MNKKYDEWVIWFNIFSMFALNIGISITGATLKTPMILTYIFNFCFFLMIYENNLIMVLCKLVLSILAGLLSFILEKNCIDTPSLFVISDILILTFVCLGLWIIAYLLENRLK